MTILGPPGIGKSRLALRLFLDAATPSVPERDGAARLEHLRRIAQETHNLAAAHRYYLAAAGSDPDGAPNALRAALALGEPLARWGPVSMLRAMLDDALRVVGC